MISASLLILTFRIVYDRYIAKGTLIDVDAFKYFFRGWESVFIIWWSLVATHFSIILILFIGIKTTVKIWLPLYILHQYILLHIGIN